MNKVKTFSNVNYISLRTEVIKWLKDHSDIEILDVIDSEGVIEKDGPRLKIKSIIYRDKR